MDPRDQLSLELQRETAALRRIARGILLEPALAEDAVQEAWLAALRSSDCEARTGSWLNEAVRRIALGLRRREARVATRERAAARDERQPSAADTAARVELLRELLDALRELDEPYRTAVQLRLVDDLPPREIARRLGIPVETTRTQVKRGLARLRARLDARHAHRRSEFLAALAPLAGFDPSGGALAALLGGKSIGGTVVGIQAKLAAAAVVAVAAGWWLWSANSSAVPDSAPAVAAARFDRSAAPSSVSGTKEGALATIAVEGDANSVGREAPPSTKFADASWVVRGRVLRDTKLPLASASVRVHVLGGFEDDGAMLHDVKLMSDADGAFTLAIDPPQQSVRVRASVSHPDYLSFVSEALIPRGESPKKELLVACYALDVTLSGRVVDPLGAPLAGAHVRGFGPACATDTEGRFKLRTSARFGETNVEAWADGFTEGRTAVQADQPGHDIDSIEIVLAPGGAVRGRVVDEHGRPVAGAAVGCIPLGHVAAKSDELGRFELRGLPLDSNWLSLTISAEGFARLRRDIEGSKLPEEELELVLARGVELAGRIVDERGAGLPGASIWLGRSRFDADAVQCISGDEGRFEARCVPRSAAKVLVDAQGFAPHDEALALPELGRVEPLTIVMRSGRTLAGTVTDERGEPLADIRLALRADGDYVGDSTGASDAAGRFSLANLPERGELELEVYGAGFVRTTVALDPAANEVQVRLARAAGLSGRVLDAVTREPIRAFRVRFVPASMQPGEQPLSGVGASWVDGGREIRDDDGRWSTAGEELAAGMVTGVEVSAPSYGPTVIGRAVTMLDVDSVPLEFLLGPAARIVGVVVDASNGSGVANAVLQRITAREAQQLWATSQFDPATRVTSGEGGEFEFASLSLESSWLVVQADGFARAVDGPFDAVPDTAPRRIELVRGATLRGELQDHEGRAVAGATVQVSRIDSRTQEYLEWTRDTDTQGRFEVGALSEGSYQVARTLRTTNVTVLDLVRTVEVRGAADVEVQLRPSGKIRLVGSVRAKGGAGSGTVSVTRVGTPSVMRSAIALGGRFELDGLEPGLWSVTVHETGHYLHARSGTAQVEASEGRDAVVLVDLEEPPPKGR